MNNILLLYCLIMVKNFINLACDSRKNKNDLTEKRLIHMNVSIINNIV